MLRISRLADYSIVIMTVLAKTSESVMNAAQIAEHAHLKQPTASKLLKILLDQKLVNSQRGAGGGYFLEKSPATISLAHIIMAVDGPIAVTQCSTHDTLCEKAELCCVKDHWMLVNDIIYRALASVTLETMCQSLKKDLFKGIPVINEAAA